MTIPDTGDNPAVVAPKLAQTVPDTPESELFSVHLATARSSRLFAPFGLSYLLGTAMLIGLVVAAGFWNLVANTRVLAALIEAGVVPLGEDDPGLLPHLPAIHLWLRSQEPVTWALVLLAAALFVTVAVLKGLQFHRIASHLGIEGSFGQHLRAYLYGNGLGRMLPYRVGEVAWASALESQGGATLPQATRLVFVFKGFQLFEIGTFAVVGLFAAGLLPWATSLVPPLLILLVAWLMVRPRRGEGSSAGTKWRTARNFVFDLAQEPQAFAGLIFLSLLSFLLVEIAAYIIPQAFTTMIVPLIRDELRIIVVTTPVIIMAVVGGYVARLIQVTPGGIGQFELAFALVLVVNGLPIPEAIVLSLLISLVRYTTGAILFTSTLLTYGIETNLERVLTLYRRPHARPSAAE